MQIQLLPGNSSSRQHPESAQGANSAVASAVSEVPSFRPWQGCPRQGCPRQGCPWQGCPCPGAGRIADAAAPHGSAAARRREGAGSARDRCHIPGMGLPLPPKSGLPLKNPFRWSLGNSFPAFSPCHSF